MTSKEQRDTDIAWDGRMNADQPLPSASLLERIAWVRNRVSTLAKDSTVDTGRGGSYKAITHDKVTKYLRPYLVRAGIIHWMTLVEHSECDTGQVTQSGKRITQHRATFEITFSSPTADVLTLRVVAYADDFGDKGPGKAQSYAMKIALMKLFMLETGEDEEERVEAARAETIGDDPSKHADMVALADELFGEHAPVVLTAMAKRVYRVDDASLIPSAYYAQAIAKLKKKAADQAAPTNTDTGDSQ